MNKISKMVLVGMVLSTSVQAQVTHNTTTSFDESWNKVIEQLVDRGIDFTADKENGIIRSRTTKRMTYGESGASCSLTPKHIIPVTEFAQDIADGARGPLASAIANAGGSPLERAQRGDSAAIASIINNQDNPRMPFDSDWGKKYLADNLNRKGYGVDFTTTPIPQTSTLSWGTRGRQTANHFRNFKINYDFTILVRSVDGGSSVRMTEKYSGDVVQWIGTTSKAMIIIFQDFGVYTWNCTNSPSTLGLTF
jgi:hypothetical protein